MTGDPWYNTSICKNYMENCFNNSLDMQELIDIISCVLLMHTKQNSSEHDDVVSGGGYPIPSNSTTEELVSLSATIDFIGCCLQALEHNLLERCNMFFFAIKNYFRKSQLNFLNQILLRKKTNHYYMILGMVGIWTN